MAERRPDQIATELLLGWLKPNAQLEAVSGRAMESFGQVGQLLSETAEAVLRKQTQLMTESMSAMAASVQELQRLRNPQDVLAAQATAFRGGMQAAVTGMRDMTEIMQRCGNGMAELWLASLAGNGQVTQPERPPVPLRKAAE
jgi:phasin family protein